MYTVYADGELMFDPSFEDGTRIILDPSLKKGMGKAGSFEFSLPVTNLLYDDIRLMRTVVTVYSDGKEKFRGRVVSCERDFNNTKKCTCEGLLAYLSDTVQQTYAFEGKVHDLFANFIYLHNIRAEEEKQFEVGEITIENKDIIVSGVSQEDSGIPFDYDQLYINYNSTEWNTALDQINTYIIANCGGYLRVRHEDGVNYIDLLKDNYGHACSQPLEFGVNITDIQVETSFEDLFTVLIPIGSDNLSIESVNDGYDELVHEELCEKYGRIIKTNVFDGVSKPEDLLENAKRYMQNNCKEPLEITVKGVDLHFVDSETEPINEGDVIHITSSPHGIDDDYVCTEVEHDLSDASNTVYTFGKPKQTLTERYKKDPAKKGGGGGAGTAKEEDDEKQFGDFYDAWIDMNPTTGYGTLGAVYKKALKTEDSLDKVVYTMTNELGLTFDAPNGEVNLQNFKSRLDEETNATKEMRANIFLLTGDNKSNKAQIEMNTIALMDTKKQSEVLAAQITQLADDTKAQISFLVKQGDEQGKGLILVKNQLVQQGEVMLTINADVTAISSKMTYIENLLAEKISVTDLEGDYAKLGNLNARSLTSDWIRTNRITSTDGIDASNGIVNGKDGAFGNTLKLNGNDVATQVWCKENFSNVSWYNIDSKPTFLQKIGTDSNGRAFFYWGWK